MLFSSDVTESPYEMDEPIDKYPNGTGRSQLPSPSRAPDQQNGDSHVPTDGSDNAEAADEGHERPSRHSRSNTEHDPVKRRVSY